MNKIEINIKGQKISLYGNKKTIEDEKSIIEKLNLTGNETKDRLIIQKCIDDNKLKSNISYLGNTVYPFEKTVKEYRKLQKEDSLEKMSNYMYKFFTLACGDIAHYDIQGFKAYYNNKLRNLENEVLKNDTFVPCWHSDLDNIFKELKINKYFYERQFINIDELSINKLKSIIKECGWNLSIKNNIWELQRKSLYGDEFSFSFNVTDKRVSEIVNSIDNYKNSFNIDDYIEEKVSSRENKENSPSIRDIVNSAHHIKGMLSTFASNIIYKSQLAVEEMNYSNKNYNLNTTIENDEYDLDFCS